ncbi:MAG: diguanylate cyclase domain-containing protein, partial [Halothece sp.]
REQVEREQLLNTITRSIRQSLDLQEIAAQTVSQIQQAFQVTRVVLAVADPQKASFELVQAIPPPETAAASLGLNYRFLQSLFQEQQELAIADVTTDSAWEEIQAFAENWGARSLLAVPIWGEHSQLKGIICLQVCHEIRHWRNHEMQLLHDVSDQLAIALQQAQLYQQLETELNQRYQLEDQLRHDAIHDQLTGLPNRIQLRNRLQQRLHHLQWENDDFAVFFLDLNKFKAVNDTLGHSAGDELLILVGQRLKNCLRETDLLVRFGGDEFVIILEHLQDQQGAIAVANRIHETLSNPILLLGNEVTVGTSIGIVLVHDQYTHPDLILRDADIAMYQAKQSGAPYIIFNDR